MMKRKEVLQRMKYAITSIGNYYPLDTVQNIQNSIDSFKNLREDLKAEAAKNIYNEAINARVSIPADNEIYRFVSLKEDAIDKGKVFECEYFYVSSSDLDDTDSFTDELDRMSTSINKAIGRSDVFKSYISVNQNDNTGKTFTTNLYTIYEDKGVYKFIKIANIEVTYYNKFTYSYEILTTFDFDVNKVYRDEDKLENDTLSESFNIDRILNDNENVDFFYLGETSTKLLESLKPSDYGIPELKKFPMHDKKHVLLAIKFFNTYVGTKYEKELANNINKKIQEFKIPDSEIHMTKVNQFKKYYIPYKGETLDEGFEVKINSFSKAIDIPKVYHCSTINLGTQKYFVPRIPDGFDTTNGYEENKTKRICVSTKIELCILAMNPEDIKTGKKLYVYTPVDMNKVNDHLMKPDTNEVEDCDATEEYWITKQTKMKLIGVIQIGKKTKAYSRLWHSISREDGMTHELRYDYYYEWKWFNIQDKDEVDLYNKINPKKLYEEVEPLNFSKFRSDYNNECKKLYYTSLKRNDDKASMIDDEQKYFNITDAIKNTSGLSNDLSCHPENLYGTHKDVFLYVYNNTTEDEKRLKPVYHGVITVHFRDEKDWDKNKDNFDWEWEYKEDLGYDKESNEIINLYEVQNKTEEIDFLLNESHVLVNMYRVDQDNFDGKILQPQVPDNYFTRNSYEDNSTPRVCFARDIKHCLRAMSCNCTGMEFYVHVPLSFYDAKSHLKRPLSKEVPGADITGEIWITRPVKLLCIGKIRVIKDTGEKGFKFKYGPHTAELYDWEWEWIEKYKNINESMILSEDFNIDFKKKENFFNSLTKNTDSTLTELIYGNIRQSISIDKVNQELIISGFNYNKFLTRLKDMYDHRGISNLFEKNYTWWSMLLWKKEKIKKGDMKISKLTCPIFFALEIYKIFLDLADEYNINYYKRIAGNIYSKTWISNYEKRPTDDSIDINQLSKIKYTLKEYQLDFIKEYKTLKFRYDLEGYILSFEQGLGKTLTSLALAECLHKDQIIIVCPNTLKENWSNEIKDYFEDYKNKDLFLRDVFVIGNSKFKFSGRTKYFIVNQESIEKVLKYTDNKKNTMIIVDECHNFRNNSSKRTQSLLALKEKLNCKDNLMMSGTPIKATPDEIIPALRMIDPYFTSDLADRYRKAFNANTTEISRVVKERFDRTIYRRTKKEVLSLPKKVVSDLYYKIPNESDYYITILNKEIKRLFKEFYEYEAKAIPKLETEFNSLVYRYSMTSKIETKRYLDFVNNTVLGKDISISEYRLELYTKFLEENVYTNPNLPTSDRLRIEELVKKYIHIRNVAMGKAIGRVLPKARANCYVDIIKNNKKDILKRIKDNPRKTVIFTAFLPVAKYLYETMEDNGIGTVLIVGSTDKNVRIDYINEFKNNDNIEVLIATTQTMSTGVTLTEANQMFFFGTPYRSSDFNQACDRIHRLGQTSDVFIYKVLLESSKKNVTNRIDDILRWSDSMFTSLIESYDILNEEKSLKSIVNTAVDIFRKHNLEPKFSKSELNKFLEKDDKLCFCGLGSNYNRINQACREANKTIKPLGYKMNPDNYGTAWLESLRPKSESLDILNEAMFLNKKDLYLNYEEWNLGRTNILLITGLSGSGKSTLGMKEASAHNAEYIELDLFEQCYMFANEDQLKEAGLVFYDYLTKNRSLYEKLKQKQIHGEELGKEIAKFLNYVITYCESKPHTKFVIEGVQIYSFMKVDKAKCYPMIIKNTSALVSMLRRIKRSFKNGEVKNLKEFRNLEIVKMLSWYFGEEKVLEEFRKACKVVLESSTASLAVVPSNGIGSNPTQVVKTYDYINSHNMLKSYYDLKDDIKKSSLFNEAIITSPKTLYGYDRVKITKDIFERYTEELRKLGYNKEGMTFNEGDKGEFIFDKNKNIKGCILITKYIVNKIPVNVLRFIYIDDSICDDKHPKEKWFTSLYNISINKYSVSCIEINKKDKYLMNEFITKNGRTILEDNGKTVLISLDDELFNTDYKLVLNNSDKNEPVKGTAKEEIPLDETIVPENTLNEIGQIASLNKLGTTSGVNSKLGLWNPIVKIGNKNYRERCEALIFDSGMVYLGVNINRIRIPGGGTHPNVLIEDQLVEECREEARINIKDIQYIGCYKNDYTDAHKEIYKKVNNLENVTYEGAITYLFIAKYDSKYTGEIKALDRDDLLQEGQFIPIARALDYNLKNEWRVALNYYLGYVDKNEDSTIYDYSSKIISNEENFKTHFLELAISDYTKNIMTESYNILTEEASSNALKAKRKKIEKLVYGFFNMIDSTGKNAEKYKKHYDSLTDKQFFKEINDMLKDDKKNFYLEILPNINEPSLKKIKETADFLGLELDEYVYFRHDGDEHTPVRTPYKVPVGYLQIRRLRVKRFWLITRPKKLCIKL